MSDRMDTLLIAMMEHEAPDAEGIQHLLKVHEFARLIGRMEGLPAGLQETLEAAAVVHDIGIHPAVIERVAYLVGRHHTYTDIDGVDYQILVEADFLVNLFENDEPPQARQAVYRRVFRTESGKRLFRAMFAPE